MQHLLASPFLDSYWVIPAKLLAGEYPGVYDPDATKKRLQAMLHAGVTTFLDLTMPGDSSHPYEKMLIKITSKSWKNIVWRNFPVPDFSVPTIEEMKEILNFIDSEINANRVVYIHCLAGIGRTGTVVGCHLVRYGLDGKEALEQITYLRREMPNWWHRSPETIEQRDFILNWTEGSIQV